MKLKFALPLFFTLATAFLACVTKAKSPLPETNGLTGNWQWVKSSGGYAGTTESAGEATTKLLNFSKDGTVTLIVNGKQELKDTYSFIRVKSIFTGAEADAIRYNTSAKVESFHINSDTLFLAEECHDCFSHTYIRKK